MKLLIAGALLALVAGCGTETTDDSGGNDAPAKPSVGDQYAALVQTRYAGCLKKLGATLDQSGPALVAFDTKSGAYLVFSVTKLANGKIITVPEKDKDTAMLESVGC